jgi:hypothetical protein
MHLDAAGIYSYLYGVGSSAARVQYYKKIIAPRNSRVHGRPRPGPGGRNTRVQGSFSDPATLLVPGLVQVMRATLVHSLCKLGLVTQASCLRSRLNHETPLSVSLLSRACKWIPEPLVRGFPDRGKPGRRDRNDMDSHVTSNTPPRSNTGSQ